MAPNAGYSVRSDPQILLLFWATNRLAKKSVDLCEPDHIPIAPICA
jgi:hypothetical protein